MADDLVDRILRRRDRLHNDRGIWATHWDDLARVLAPRRLGFVTQTTTGERRTEDIFDGTGMQAARALANAIGTFLRPQGEPWFFIRADGATDGEGEEWIRDTEERMRDAFENPDARFLQATGECDLDLVVFGTGVLFEGEGERSLLFQTLHLKDALPMFSDSGVVEGVIRDHKLTVRQALRRFGDRVSRETISWTARSILSTRLSPARRRSTGPCLRATSPSPISGSSETRR